MENTNVRFCILILFIITFASTAGAAQLGEGRKEYEPVIKIHLVDFNYTSHPIGICSLDWKPNTEVGSPNPCSSYEYNLESNTETFNLIDKRAIRSEIVLENEYGIGSRQFGGIERITNT